MMSFWEWLTIIGVVVGSIGTWLTVYGFFNNRAIKALIASNDTKLEQSHKGTMDSLEQSRKATLESIERNHKATLDALQYIGNLIVVDGEKTREILREIKSRV